MMIFWEKQYRLCRINDWSIYGIATYTRNVSQPPTVEGLFGAMTYSSDGSDIQYCNTTSINDWQLKLYLSMYHTRAFDNIEYEATSLRVRCHTQDNFNKFLNEPHFVANSEDHSFKVTFDWDNDSYQSNLLQVLAKLSDVMPDGEELAESINNELKINRQDLKLNDFPPEQVSSKACCIS